MRTTSPVTCLCGHTVPHTGQGSHGGSVQRKPAELRPPGPSSQHACLWELHGRGEFTADCPGLEGVLLALSFLASPWYCWSKHGGGCAANKADKLEAKGKNRERKIKANKRSAMETSNSKTSRRQDLIIKWRPDTSGEILLRPGA